MTPDERARLEIERDFLLESLRDLDAEMAAGDIEPEDYATLKDSYIARTADVLRRLEDRATPSERVKSSWVLWTAVVLIIAVVSGILISRSSDDRLPGQTMTGGSGDGSVSSLLVQARSLGMSDMARVLELYAEVLSVEPDNVEALTYFGWFSVLSAVQSEQSEDASQRLESGLLLLRQATITDPTYADAHCFLGIVFFRFLDDAAAAQPEIEQCLAADPPAEVFTLVENLADEIAAAGTASTDESPDSDSVGSTSETAPTSP